MRIKFLPFATVLFLVFEMAITHSFGQPEFADPISNPFGLSYHEDVQNRLRLVDIDHDDTLEAFVRYFSYDPPSYEPQGIDYYENEGNNEDPDFVFVESAPFGIPSPSPNFPWQFVDIDGDGMDDLFFWRFGLNVPVRMLKNVGTPTVPNFEGPFIENPFGITLPTSSTGNFLDSVVPIFVDIDSDGDYDLFYAGIFQNEMPENALFFSENIGDSTDPLFLPPEKNAFGLNFPTGIGNHWEHFVDADCDGDQDMYFFGFASPSHHWAYFENTGTPTEPDFSTPGQSTMVFFPFAGSFVDIGNDGDLDLICPSGGVVSYFENISSPEVDFSYVQDGLTFNFTDNSSDNATAWLWDFGDGTTSDIQNPQHTYPNNGTYEFCLTVGGDLNCSNTACDTIVIMVSGSSETRLNASLSLHPNPARDVLMIDLQINEHLEELDIGIFDILGQKVKSLHRQPSGNILQVEIVLEGLPEGIYTVRVGSKGKFISRKFVRIP